MLSSCRVWITAKPCLPDHLSTITDTLQHVLNAAACLVSGTRKFDQGLSRLLHDELQHWLNVPERVRYKLAVMVHRCLQNKAPKYLVDHCIPASNIASRHHLRSASRHFFYCSAISMKHVQPSGLRCWGLMDWNSLPDNLRDPLLFSSSFRRGLKLYFSQDTSVFGTIEMLHDIALYKFNIDIDIQTLTSSISQTCCLCIHTNNVQDAFNMHWIL